MEQNTFYPTNRKLSPELISDADNLVKKISEFFDDRFTVTKQGQTTLGRHFAIFPKNDYLNGIEFEDIDKLEKEFKLKASHIILSKDNPHIVLFQSWANVKAVKQ